MWPQSKNLVRTYLQQPNYQQYEEIILNSLKNAYRIDKEQKGYKIWRRMNTLKLIIETYTKLNKPEESGKISKGT